MTTQTEALKMALKAMKSFQEGTNGLYEGEFNEEIKTCEEALSNTTEQEPAAWVYPEFWDHLKSVHCGTAYAFDGKGPNSDVERQPLYTTPPQRKPLTDEQIDKAIQQHVDPVATYRKLHAFARAIEAKLKEKNA